MKQISPKEIIENTAEVHEFKNTNKSIIIYLIILTSLILAFASMPFLRVDVYTSARGVIKPNKERVTLNVINSGQVIYSNIINNKKISQGDTLLIIDNNGIDNQLEFSKYQLQETELFTKDLTLLLSEKRIYHSQIQSSKYKRVFIEYLQKLSELNTRLKKVKLDFNRYKILFNKGVISKVEYEENKFNYDLGLNNLYQFKKQQQNLWQADLTQYNNKSKELKSGKERLLKSKTQYTIKSPITGVLLNVKPLEKGSFINAGTPLGKIYPDTDLLVECYINPSEIGLLKSKSKINFQIDAYNYNQWGLVTGEIIEIGKDIVLIDNNPVFKVRCKMDYNYLKLKNGFKGNLKKGMTLNANFEVAERSLFDLLYDIMDDWSNPSILELQDIDT